MSKVSIGFTGDFCPWERMEKAYFEKTWKNSLSPVQGFFTQNDFNVLDLECPLTLSKNSIPKTGPQIKSHPDTVEILKYLNCAHVVTANNHFKDYGWQGMQDTYHALQTQGIQWLGSGKNATEAAKPLVLEKKGIKITLLNMAEHEWSIASAEEAGCNPIDYPRAILQIKEAKACGSDFVVVVLHGGHEHYALPSPRIKAQFRFMVDAGADAVVGHHTHIVSGFEVYNKAPIFYSLGNFCFDWPGLRRGTWNKGMLLRLIFEKGKAPEFDYSFIHQNDDFVGVQLLDNIASKAMEVELTRLGMVILDDKALAESFTNYAVGLKAIMLSRIQPYRNRFLVALHKRKILPDIMGKRKKQMLQILTQCESHREVLLAALNNIK